MAAGSPRLRTVLALLFALAAVQAGTVVPADSAVAATSDGYAQQVVDLTNQQRRGHGCDDVAVDSHLTEAAQEHSDDMATNDYFDHESPDGRDPGDRIADAGYEGDSWAENIAAGYETPAEVVDEWMHSPGHRANILDCDLHDIGVGHADADDAEYDNYWTQDFGSE